MLSIDLTGRVSLVTGAGRGIGATVALQLATAGAKLVLVDQNGPALEETASQIRAAGGEAIVCVGDVADPGLAPAVVAAGVERFGTIDILVNDAAINIREKAMEVELEHWDRILAVNLRGYFLFRGRRPGRCLPRGGEVSSISAPS